MKEGRPEKMKIHLLRRAIQLPARWPESHHGGAAAPENLTLFF